MATPIKIILLIQGLVITISLAIIVYLIIRRIRMRRKEDFEMRDN